MSWGLPTECELPSGHYDINGDYRDILDIIEHLQNPDDTDTERTYIALALFYEKFEKMPESDYQAAINYLMAFINCGEPEIDTRPAPKQIDWTQDELMIAADINKVAGYEIRALPFLHWFSFIGYFNGIGEGQLATVVSIREKRRKGQKLEAWEREYYMQNKSKIVLRQQYSAEEQAEIDRLKGLLGE